eukprot:TRINITY_DN70237_c0_g1_i1.p1 TRINITY_DN70237_c0_g1~~TRINITY_DN70237_c0_g1_i1.p1  ORF type:complete len:456 (+),score=90.39 TRINITY_DN70237_c0_g1_i1:52-1419(+)
MEPHDLKELLTAAANELAAVAADLPCGESARRVRKVLAESHRAAEDAAASVAFTTFEVHSTTDAVRESLAMRNDAASTRDAADAELLELRSQQESLLRRLTNLTEERREKAEERQVETEARASREQALMLQCLDLEQQVDEARQSIDAKNRRLYALKERIHSLGVDHLRLQRKHEDTMVENEIAREILELQKTTKAYLKDHRGRCKDVDRSRLAAQKACQERLEDVHAEWTADEKMYHQEMEEFETRLEQLQRDFGERWQATEVDRKLRLEEKAKRLADARCQFEDEFAELDEAKAAERARAQAQIERNAALIVEERHQVAAEMEERLCERRAELSEQVEGERKRAQAQISKQSRRIGVLVDEVNHFKGLIEDVHNTYRGGYRRPVGGTSPRSGTQLDLPVVETPRSAAPSRPGSRGYASGGNRVSILSPVGAAIGGLMDEKPATPQRRLNMSLQ